MSDKMIGKTIRRGGSHYKILEKLGGRGPARRSFDIAVEIL